LIGTITYEVLTGVIDSNYVWMIKTRSRLSFTAKSFLEHRITSKIRAQNFNSYASIKSTVSTFINFSHAAAANYLSDVISITKLGEGTH
jgi:hypothetical protein